MGSLSSQPTIIDFMDAVGEQTSNMTRKIIKQCTNRNMLRLSAKWANTVTTQRRHLYHVGGVGEMPGHFEKELEQVLCTLSPECALLEVDAISLLSSLESSSGQRCISNSDDDEDSCENELSAELRSLEESTRSLQEELESIKFNTLSSSDEEETSSNAVERWPIIARSASLFDLTKYG
eukprot:CAMPEP_0185725928 /NCGR_PEP_ID=MMETSP1171-20130828/2055_1 /TAXON_ID=374046 /ORGANISM="Helicotheca tamensis, Strain CCMP826" /LENGTH=178 /DNA_ID=CAMNT_0028394173 /DNA_START=116 /DNA_END=649 /DNA_ORIENTATION=-